VYWGLTQNDGVKVKSLLRLWQATEMDFKYGKNLSKYLWTHIHRSPPWKRQE